jgi:hypothetical protein
MCIKPNSKPLSLKTGYLYSNYLQLRNIIEALDNAAKQLKDLEPWLESEKTSR